VQFRFDLENDAASLGDGPGGILARRIAELTTTAGRSAARSGTTASTWRKPRSPNPTSDSAPWKR
jgi:hypothetical protein